MLTGIVACIGAGLWQVGVSNLPVGAKAGVGIGLACVLGFIGLFLLSFYRRRRQLEAVREEHIDNRDSNRVVNWIMLSDLVGTAKPKPTIQVE